MCLGWVVVGIIWLSLSTIGVGIYPLWESRATIAHVTRAIVGDLRGKPVVQGRADEAEQSDDKSSSVNEGVATKEAGAVRSKVEA